MKAVLFSLAVLWTFCTLILGALTVVTAVTAQWGLAGVFALGTSVAWVGSAWLTRMLSDETSSESS